MHVFLQRAQRWFARLNFFESSSSNQETRLRERWSSWIYITLCIAILGALTVNRGLGRQTATVEIDNPSYSTFESLQRKHPSTIRCPCSNTAVPYSTHSQISVTFHQVCSSSFITDEWIAATLKTNTSDTWPMDARALATSQAQGLRFVCEMSKAAVDSVITSFRAMATYTPDAISTASVELSIKSLSESVSSYVSTQSSAVLALSSFASSGEMLISVLGTNAVAYMAPEVPTKPSLAINAYRMLDGSMCYCLPARKCSAPALIYSSRASHTRGVLTIDTNNTVAIKGMRTDCYPYDALIALTLECYYDLACLQLLVTNASSVKTLNVSLPSKYAITDIVGELVASAMVEAYQFNYSAEKHYATCAPHTCVYSNTQGSTLLIIITTMIGLIGGLNTGLTFFAPLLVSLLFKIKNRLRRRANGDPSIVLTIVPSLDRTFSVSALVFNVNQRIIGLLVKVKDLNLFHAESNDPLASDRQRHITRLYIILLLSTFIILSFHVGFSQIINDYTISNPSQSDYLSLLANYPDSLRCPCSNPNIAYSKFTTVNVTFHQICSSGFVSPVFISQLFIFDVINTHKHDFMSMSAVYFTHIALLCVLTNNAISQSYEENLYRKFFTLKILTPDVFEKKIKSDMSSFRALTAAYLNRDTSELFEFTTVSFALSVAYNSFDLRIDLDDNVRIEPNGFSNCSCIIDANTCSTDAAFYDYNPGNDSLTMLSKVMGIRVACTPF